MGFWMLFLIFGALTVLSDLLKPKPETENAKPAGIGDFQFPTATEGRRVPLLWGKVRISGPNVVWWGDLVQKAIVEDVKTGLFSSEEIVKGYKYRIGWQAALCEGPIDELTRIWIGDDLVLDGSFEHNDTFTIDEPELFGGLDLGSGGIEGTFRLFAGTDTQAASDYLSEFQKEPPLTGDTPGYHDLCYIVPDEIPTYVGTSTSIKAWKYEVRRCPNGLALTANRHIVNDGDANPMNVIYEVMTNTRWGKKIPTADINTANFVTAANTLFDEGNGFSFLLDREEDLVKLIERIEQQIDAIVYRNPVTFKWEVKLIRNDYVLASVPEMTESNSRMTDFSKGTWEGTSNQVVIPFNQRDDEYKETAATAQDMANLRILGTIVPATISHPGVKDATLADSLAWRELRTLCQPLDSGTWDVDRSFFGVLPGDVVSFTDADLGYVQLPIRVRKVDYGSLLDGWITISGVQDVFQASAGSFGPPPLTGWEPPADELVAFPAAEQLAFEAPRALTLRDPGSVTPYVDKVFAAAREQGPEVSFKIVERHSVGTPSGDFDEIGEVFAFARIGELLSGLAVGSAYPLTSLTIVPDPDTQSALETAFPDVLDLVELGTELLTLCMVGNEFFLVTSAQNSGANVQLNGVYRGVLDSVQEAHLAGDAVFLIFVGSGISEDTIPAGQNVHVKLLPRSLSDILDEIDATQIAFTMNDRTRRPYPPSELELNGTRFATTASLEGSGTGEGIGILLAFTRRDFRTVDEVAALEIDAPDIFPDYPAANTTTHEVDVINDPAGAATLLFVHDLAALASGTLLRLEILKATDGVLPTTLGLRLRSTHLFESVSLDSLFDLVWSFAVTSALTGKFNFGALDTGDISFVFTVVTDVDHVFTLSSAFTGGNVDARINGGAFNTIIAAGLTTGSILAAAIVVGDTIEVRHTSTDPGALKLLSMTVSSVLQAYAVLFV